MSAGTWARYKALNASTKSYDAIALDQALIQWHTINKTRYNMQQYWLERDGQAMQPVQIAQSSAAPTISAHSTLQDVINLAPGNYMLFFVPEIAGTFGVEQQFPFHIRGAGQISCRVE
jgi:hypothetical protein